MTAFDDLRLDLICRAALANAAQVGRAISANASDGVAALAALGLKDHRPSLRDVCICRVSSGTICNSGDGNCAGDESDTYAHGASKRTRHVQFILSKVRVVV